MAAAKVAVLHYTASPVVGGVEAVIQAHTQVLASAGYEVAVIAGRGEARAQPQGVEYLELPLLDSQHECILELNEQLEQGRIPGGFEGVAAQIGQALAPSLEGIDSLICHNVFTKHFNLPLTAALFQLLDEGALPNCIAWCHDFTWTSPNSRHKVHPGWPWDLLRTYRREISYVVVSAERQVQLAELLGVPREDVRVIYNGVEPHDLLGLTAEGSRLVERLGLLDSDLVLLMPVRVTRAKNIELALRTLAVLRGGGLDAALVISGPPDPHDPHSMSYYDSLRDLRRELALEGAAHFVFESGAAPDEPYLVDYPVVADLYRAADLMLMPSHREGFGMPVLEAGLLGLPVVSTSVPAARELASDGVRFFEADDPPEKVAMLILDWAFTSPRHQLRRRVRQGYTWQAIFRQQIEPLLKLEVEPT